MSRSWSTPARSRTSPCPGSSGSHGPARSWAAVRTTRASALPDPRQLVLRLGRLFRGGKLVHEELEARLGQRELAELGQPQGFLVERGRDAVAPGVGDRHRPELLDGSLELLRRPI